jgi:hypothetical protein
MTDTAIVIDQSKAALRGRARENLVDLIAIGGAVEEMSPSRDGNLWANRDECLARRSLRDLDDSVARVDPWADGLPRHLRRPPRPTSADPLPEPARVLGSAPGVRPLASPRRHPRAGHPAARLASRSLSHPRSGPAAGCPDAKKPADLRLRAEVERILRPVVGEKLDLQVTN